MTEERIVSIMRRDFPRLTPEMPIREATARLAEDGATAAPVVDAAGALVGILTQKDCFRSALHASYYRQWEGTVADRVTREVATLDASTDFVTAAEAFLEKPYRCYPVLENGELVGMLDRSDLLRTFLRFG